MIRNDAPINVFQAILDRGYEISGSSFVFADLFYQNKARWDVIDLFLERNPNLFNENHFGHDIGAKIAEIHEMERYQWAINSGTEPHIRHLRLAILNTSILEKNQSQYLTLYPMASWLGN